MLSKIELARLARTSKGSHPGALESLRVLNPSRVDTTQVYLRALHRSHLMADVRGPTWRRDSWRIDRRRIRDSNPCYRRERAAS
jgi:hypothetical protein